ncbi:MAG: alpha/beta fold hydrolase, partial [Pseudomonadota bacterium]
RLEATYLRRPSDMETVAGTRLHVRDDGPAEARAANAARGPIVLIHGFGASLHTWKGWAGPLSETRRVIRFDLPGSGLSPPDATGRYTDERAAEIILGILDDKGISRATLIGNSIGGRIAWRFAARHPKRTDRLVLISPDGFASQGFAYGVAPDISPMASAMRAVLPRAFVRANLAPSYGDPNAMTEAALDRYYDLLRAPGGRGALIERMRQTVLVDPRPLLAQITAPTLLIWGEKDRLIPVSNAQDYLAALPEADLAIFPALGHVPQEEAPADSLAPVRAFLDR